MTLVTSWVELYGSGLRANLDQFLRGDEFAMIQRWPGDGRQLWLGDAVRLHSASRPKGIDTRKLHINSNEIEVDIVYGYLPDPITPPTKWERTPRSRFADSLGLIETPISHIIHFCVPLNALDQLELVA